jgi:hypothetical protein
MGCTMRIRKEGTPSPALFSALSAALALSAACHGDKLADSSPGSPPARSSAVRVLSDGQVCIVSTVTIGFLSMPTSTAAGATMAPVRVAVVDINGNTITAFTGAVELTITPSTNPGGAMLGGTTTVNAVEGVATFSDLSITKAGSGYRLDAVTDGFPAFTSGPFAIRPGIAHHPRFDVQPSNTAVNQAIAPPVQVAVLDIYDNVATSFTGIVYITMGNDPTWGDAQLEPSGDKRAASAGIATFDALRLDRAGVGYTVVASAMAVHALQSTPFNVIR